MDIYCSNMRVILKDFATQWLQEQNLNVLVHRPVKVSTLQLLEYRKARRILVTSVNNFSTVFGPKIQALHDKELERFIQNSDTELNRTTLDELESFNFDQFCLSRFQLYLGNCDVDLDEISRQKRHFLSGSVKAEMTGWWLTLITNEVDEFLLDRGFHVDAVPYDYTVRAPDKIIHVRENMNLIQKVLKKN